MAHVIFTTAATHASSSIFTTWLPRGSKSRSLRASCTLRSLHTSNSYMTPRNLVLISSSGSFTDSNNVPRHAKSPRVNSLRPRSIFVTSSKLRPWSHLVMPTHSLHSSTLAVLYSTPNCYTIPSSTHTKLRKQKFTLHTPPVPLNSYAKLSTVVTKMLLGNSLRSSCGSFIPKT